MIIFDKRQPTRAFFEDIESGECFIDGEGDLNIKLDVSIYAVEEDDRPNAVALASGVAWYCSNDVEVTKVKARITITE